MVGLFGAKMPRKGASWTAADLLLAKAQIEKCAEVVVHPVSRRAGVKTFVTLVLLALSI